MPVRNSCVARGVINTSDSKTIYTVPASSVLLLKQFTLENDNSVAGQIIITVHAADGSAAVQVFNQTMNSGALATWAGWVALNAGDYITLACNTVSGHYWLSGATLPYATP